jgi:hypothetical protein
MAKSFYSQEEVCQKLEMTAAELKIAVRDGKLREFRDGGKVTYKVDEVDRLAAAEEAVAGDELTAGFAERIARRSGQPEHRRADTG